MHPALRRLVFRGAINQASFPLDLSGHYAALHHHEGDLTLRHPETLIFHRNCLVGWYRCEEGLALGGQAFPKEPRGGDLI